MFLWKLWLWYHSCMFDKIFRTAAQTIVYSFYALFAFTPFIMTPVNYELFEYNKMLFVYALTAIITSAWLVKMIIRRRIEFVFTPLGIPLLLFLASQVVSTFTSIDRHVSIFGYYSRVNGGLLSIICYVLLYFAFSAHFPAVRIRKLLDAAIISGVLVSIYGILEHFGGSISCLLITGNFDVNCWVQDVQNRVFATLGQPNWLAAYVSILLPVTLGLGIQKLPAEDDNKSVTDTGKLAAFMYFAAAVLLYLCLIFTKSRSGFLGFWAANAFFWIMIIVAFKSKILKTLFILNFAFLILNFIFATPFEQLNRFTIPHLIRYENKGNTSNDMNTSPKLTGDSIIDTGVTESGNIRQIVWKGALDIFRHYPLFGSGVETFAFAYYQYRPVEHNLTSEWDFLYNKAHNEYLNYAATTGMFGFGTYFIYILGFIIWFGTGSVKAIFHRQLQERKSGNDSTLHHKTEYNNVHSHHYQLPTTNYPLLPLALFSGWLTILITNFFGFSVVAVQIYFYLFPAIIFMYYRRDKVNISLPDDIKTHIVSRKLSIFDYTLTGAVIFGLIMALQRLASVWHADTVFAQGYRLYKQQQVPESYEQLKKSIELNPTEPFYLDEFALPAAQLALTAAEQNETTLAGQLAQEAEFATDLATGISPNNVNFWKTRTRVFFALAESDETGVKTAIESLEKARSLSPTDPKIYYNLGLIYDRDGRNDEALKSFEEAAKLKPDYRDAYFALGMYYEKLKRNDEAKTTYEYILKRINPKDEEVKKKLEEMK